jgi:hypothetical protein
MRCCVLLYAPDLEGIIGNFPVFAGEKHQRF